MVNDMLILARFRGVLASWQVVHLDAESGLAASGRLQHSHRRQYGAGTLLGRSVGPKAGRRFRRPDYAIRSSGWWLCSAEQERGRGLAVDSFRKQISLPKHAACGEQLASLVFRLDAFRNDPYIKLARNLNQPLDDRHAGVTGREARDETLVDLYNIDGNRQKVRQ